MCTRCCVSMYIDTCTYVYTGNVVGRALYPRQMKVYITTFIVYDFRFNPFFTRLIFSYSFSRTYLITLNCAYAYAFYVVCKILTSQNKFYIDITEERKIT